MEGCLFESSWPEYVLDRVIVIAEGHEHKVSGYKLAKASEVFREELRGARARELGRAEGDEDTTTNRGPVEGLARPQSVPSRTRSRSLGQLQAERLRVPYEDAPGLELLLSFVHSQQEPPVLNLSLTNIRSVIRAAIFFKTPSLLSFVQGHLQTSISPLDCWQLLALSEDLVQDFPALAGIAQGYLLEHFLTVCVSTDFLQASLSQLTFLLSQDSLCVSNENLLLLPIDRWVAHSPDSRAPHFPSLLETLRLGRLSPQDLVNLSSHPFVLQYWKQCHPLLTWARLTPLDVAALDTPLKVQHLTLASTQKSMEAVLTQKIKDLTTIPSMKPPKSQDPSSSSSSLKNVQSDPVSPKSSTEIRDLIMYLHRARSPREALVVVGGWEGNQDDPNFGPSKAIQVYDNRANNWKRIIGDRVGLDEGHAYSGCVLHNNKVYVIGGYVASGPTQTLKMFDLGSGQWKYLSPMHEKRNYVTTCLLDDFIYTIGGHNGRNRLSSVERYDPAQNNWTFVCPMRQVRSDAGCDSVLGKLYVCGGFDGHHFYASVEMYDPKVDQWSSVAPMSNIRSGVSVIAFKQFLFAIGGNDGLQRLRTVERFDPVANRWLTMPSMIRQRSNFCLAVLEDEIYVMGGWSDETNSTIALVEKWSPGLSNPWIQVQPLFMPASANCCCTVKGIGNIRQLLSN